MPSSSTRSTLIELSLLHQYRTTVVRLWGCHMIQEANIITEHFTEILDIDNKELISLLRPRWIPDSLKHWNELQFSNARMRQSAKIYSAGSALADAGAELFKVGRDNEASTLCSLGSELWGMAISENEFEEKFKYSGGSRNDPIDLEMKY